MDNGYECVTEFTARVVYRSHSDDDVHALLEEAVRVALGPNVLLRCESTTSKTDTWQGWKEGPSPVILPDA